MVSQVSKPGGVESSVPLVGLKQRETCPADNLGKVLAGRFNIH